MGWVFFLFRGGKLNNEKSTEITYDEGLRWPPFDILHATTNQMPRKVVVEIGVGVDLGTTNSAVAAMIGGAPGRARWPVVIPIRSNDDDVDNGGGGGGDGAEGGRRRRRGRRGSAAMTTTTMPSVVSIPLRAKGTTITTTTTTTRDGGDGLIPRSLPPPPLRQRRQRRRLPSPPRYSGRRQRRPRQRALAAAGTCYLSKGGRLTSIVGLGRPLNRN